MIIICINKSDAKEKGHQLALVGDIYARAQETYVWLGEGNGLSDQTIKLIRELRQPKYFSWENSVAETKIDGFSQPWKAAWSLYLDSWNPLRKPYIHDSTATASQCQTWSWLIH
jgi:hypothetical protein